MTSAPKKKSNAGLIALVVILLACPLLIAVAGVIAAIAIPSFVRYERAAQTAEATTNLASIATRMEAYYVEFQQYPSAPASPPEPPCGTRELFVGDAAWTQIGFSPFDPVRYSYEVEATADGYVIRARGDLDCDGVTSLFERTSDGPTVRTENEDE